MTENDSLIEDYLAAVERATADLPADRRAELLRDLREHIDSGRAELPDETEHQVREILEHLGTPAVIARAAAAEEGVAPAIAPAPPNRRPLWIVLGIAAVIGLLVLCSGWLFLARSDSGQPMPAEPAEPARPAATSQPG